MNPGEHGWLKLRGKRDGKTIEHSGEYQYLGAHQDGAHEFKPVDGTPNIYLAHSEIVSFGPRGHATLVARPPGLSVFAPDGVAGEVVYRRGFWIVPPAEPVFVGDLPAAAAQAIEEHGLTLDGDAVESLRGLMQ